MNLKNSFQKIEWNFLFPISIFILKEGLFNLYGNLTSLDNYISTFNGGYKYVKMFENTNVYDCSKLNIGIKSFTGS